MFAVFPLGMETTYPPDKTICFSAGTPFGLLNTKTNPVRTTGVHNIYSK